MKGLFQSLVDKDLLKAMNKAENLYKSLLTEATNVTEFDNLIDVKTFDNISYLIKGNQFDTCVLLGQTGTGKTKSGFQPLVMVST
ncbi:hypothetical protein ViNHUV68_34680 [Vibrio sp. NH-UV-68]